MDEENHIQAQSRAWAVKRITVNLAKVEVSKLEAYCKKNGVEQNATIRKLIRSLENEERLDDR